MKTTQHHLIPNLSTIIDDVLGSQTFETVKRNLIHRIPLANIYENETNHLIKLAIPGVSKEEIVIELEDKKLKISSSIEKKVEENMDKEVRKEFQYSSFSRLFNLPKNIDSNKIEATCENGVLTVFIPKKEEELKKNKTIVVK